MPSGMLITLEASNNARIPLPRWFVVGSEGTLTAEGAWGCWTQMRIRRSLADMPADIIPQGVGPSSGGRGMDVGEQLSACFYDDLQEALTKKRPSAITAQRARDVIAILETAREAHKTGQVVKPTAPKDAATKKA